MKNISGIESHRKIVYSLKVRISFIIPKFYNENYVNQFGPYDFRILLVNVNLSFQNKQKMMIIWTKNMFTLYNKCRIHSLKLINRPVKQIQKPIMKTSRTTSEVKDTDKTVYPKCNMKK